MITVMTWAFGRVGVFIYPLFFLLFRVS